MRLYARTRVCQTDCFSSLDAELENSRRSDLIPSSSREGLNLIVRFSKMIFVLSSDCWGGKFAPILVPVCALVVLQINSMIQRNLRFYWHFTIFKFYKQSSEGLCKIIKQKPVSLDCFGSLLAREENDLFIFNLPHKSVELIVLPQWKKTNKKFEKCCICAFQFGKWQCDRPTKLPLCHVIIWVLFLSWFVVTIILHHPFFHFPLKNAHQHAVCK